MSDNNEKSRGRPQKGVRIRGMYWLGNVLHQSGVATLVELDDLLNEQLPQTVKWREFLAGRRDPSDQKIPAVERGVPGTAKCWHSPLWRIQQGSWLDEGQIRDFITERGWTSMLTFSEGQTPSSHVSIHPQFARGIKESANFESLEALAVLLNLARVAKSSELADEVEGLYLSCLPALSRMPQIAHSADVFFAEMTKLFQQSALSLRNKVNVAASAVTQESRRPEAHCELQTAEHYPVGATEETENAELKPQKSQARRLQDWPWVRIINGLIAILILAIVNITNPALLLSIVATVLIATAVDTRVANYKAV